MTNDNGTSDCKQSHREPCTDVDVAGALSVRAGASVFLSAVGESTGPGVSRDEADIGSSAFESEVFSDAVENDGFAPWTLCILCL